MREYRLGMSVALTLTTVVAMTAIAGDDGPGEVSDIQKALSLLERGKFEKAEQAAFDLATNPDAPNCRAWLIVANARRNQGKYGKAIKAYKNFLESCESTELREFVLRQINLCHNAVKKKAEPVLPSSTLTKNDLKELAEVSNESSIEVTEHFVIHTSNAKLAEILAIQAEKALARICHVILAGQQYSHSVDIYVWPDLKTYAENAENAPDWSGGRFTLSNSNGVVTRRIDLTQMDEKGNFSAVMLDRILPHEMCHLVLSEYFGNSPFPLVLSEGLAMLAESQIDNRRLILAGTALASDQKIPLSELLATQRYEIENPMIFYAEAFSLMQFVHSRLSGQQFRDLLTNIKGGQTFIDAIQRALYSPLSKSFMEDFTLAWEDYAIVHAQFLHALEGKD